MVCLVRRGRWYLAQIGSAIPGDPVRNASKSEYGELATQSLLSRASSSHLRELLASVVGDVGGTF